MSDTKDETLRTVLIKCLSALAIGVIPMFCVSPYVMDALIKIMLRDNSIALNFFSPLEVFMLQIKMTLVLDILVCFPYIAKQFWNFILPALYDNERYFIKSIVMASSSWLVISVSVMLNDIIEER